MPDPGVLLFMKYWEIRALELYHINSKALKDTKISIAVSQIKYRYINFHL